MHFMSFLYWVHYKYADDDDDDDGDAVRSAVYAAQKCTNQFRLTLSNRRSLQLFFTGAASPAEGSEKERDILTSGVCLYL